MLPKADLHIHTQCSDGRLTPVEAVEMAHQKKLCALSITDHDTFEGYFLASQRAEELGIELVPGVEITASFKNRECHLLAYGFDVEQEEFKLFFTQQKITRRQRIKGIIEKVKAKGVDVEYDEVWAEANGANIGRPHLAKVLVQKGYARNKKDAFIRYLSSKNLGTLDQYYPPFDEVIQMVKRFGGACVLAHPSRWFSEDEIEQFIEAGIDGIECIHPSHPYKLQKKYAELCESRGLLITGGSDYHGKKDVGYSHVGVITVAEKHLIKMKRMIERRKKLTISS
ncbi:MAG: PHP domain-containing protein [Bacteroidota bacterium]